MSNRINEAYKIGRAFGQGEITERTVGQYLDTVKVSQEEPSLRLLMRLREAVANGEQTFADIYISELMERESNA